MQTNSLWYLIISHFSIIMEYADKGDLYQKIVEHQKSGQYMKESEIWNVIT